MGKIDDLLASFAPDSADFNVDDFRNSLLAAHNEDLSVRDSKINAEIESRVKAEEEVTRWKAKNWDLLQQIPADPKAVTTPGQSNGTENDETNVPVESLFGKKE